MEPTILYHYCSNLAFHSILAQKKVRLSLLSMSNDSKEGQHIIDAAARVLPNSFKHKRDALEQLQQVISLISAIGFCLSADGDVLSQWRGYADNAQGVAIGFDFTAMDEAAEQDTNDEIIVRLTPILYDEHILMQIMEPDLQPVIEHFTKGKMRKPLVDTILSPMTDEEKEKETERYKKAIDELGYMLMKIANYAFMVKAPFFQEEKEWRIAALLTNLGEALVLPNAQFQPSAEKLKPFRDFPLQGFPPSVIREIVLGPRNQTPNQVVRLYLDSQGFQHVSVRRSVGSYR